ncbi:MAG: TIGR03087 family PEP-CTERM/XrtA system glycosyltransferase [Phycisphaeraceae bacterium]
MFTHLQQATLSGPSLLLAGDSAPGRRKRVLFLTHRVPFPPDRGDRIRAYHMLKYLSQRFDVSLACASDEPVTEGQMHILEGLADRVAIQPISPRWGKIRGLLSLATGGAITPAYFYRKPLSRTIRNWHAVQPFDAVLTYCTGMINYARDVIRSSPAGHKPRHVIDLVDVDSAKWNEYARHARAPMKWLYATEAKRIAAIESGQRDHFDSIAVVSDAEAETYRREVGEHEGLTVLRHAVDTNYFKPLPDAGSWTLVFVGVLNYKPNVEGISWFVKNVMPLLRHHLPNVKLQIVGRAPTPAVLALNDEPNVEVVGPVPDVRKYLRSASAAIAPLRIARGVQTKVLEAMASGRVAVCSPGAAEGIHAEAGKHLLIATEPQHWVDVLSQVLQDGHLRTAIATAARAQVEAIYPWEKCLAPLAELLTGEKKTREERIAA